MIKYILTGIIFIHLITLFIIDNQQRDTTNNPILITSPSNNPCLPISPCKNGGTCITETVNGFWRCDCPSGWTGRDCGFSTD